jgi:hypothetical protein
MEMKIVRAGEGKRIQGTEAFSVAATGIQLYESGILQVAPFIQQDGLF